MSAAARQRLPARRACESFDIRVGGLRYTVSVGYYESGRIGEIFIQNHKQGSEAGIMASDAAVAASLALQHGTPIETLLPRHDARQPRPAVGAARRGARPDLPGGDAMTTDAAINEMIAEPAPPIPVPVAAAELEVAPPQADAPAELAAERTLPDGIEHLGSTRLAILDVFVDLEPGAEQSMGQLKAALPTVLPTTVEACVRREWQQGRLLKVRPGVYRLAPPPDLSKAAAPPEVRSDGMSDDAWFSLLDEYAASGKWEGPGNAPGEAGCAVPPAIVSRHNDRVRKRGERAREREAARSRQAEADRELRDKLIAATGGNFQPGPGLEDLAPIRAALQFGVPLGRVLSAVQAKVDRRMYPRNEPATSWREERLLREIAENYFQMLVPNLVAAWQAAGKAPAPKESSPPAAEPAPAAVPPPTSVEPVDASEASAAEPVAVDDTSEAAAAPVVGRAAILAAFNRAPPSPQPATQPAAPQPRPAQRQADRQTDREPLSEAAIDDLCAGYAAGNMAWPRRLLGPGPGESGCRISPAILRRNGLA